MSYSMYVNSLQGLPSQVYSYITVTMVDSGVMVDCKKVKTTSHVIQNYVCSLALIDFNNHPIFTAVNGKS